MGQRIDKTVRGLAVQSDAMTLDTLQDIGIGTLDSAFVQRGPRPGQAETANTGTRIEPAISGGQEQAVELQVRQAGMPERAGGGVELIWRLDSESADDSAWRGWNPPNVQANWIAAVWSDLVNFESFDLIVTRDDQQLVLLYIETGAEPVQSKTFDFGATAPAWGAAVTVSVDPFDAVDATESVSSNVVAGVALPNGRILAMADGIATGESYSMWASDDTGTTWYRYAAPGYTGSVVFGAGVEDQWRLEYYRGDLIFLRETTVGRVDQWASGDLGATFEFVSALDPLGSDVSISALPNGAGLVLGYIRDSDGFPHVRVLSGAFDAFTDAAEIQIDAVLIDSMTCAVDGVGNVWMFGTLSANPEIVAVWVSEDNGVTWDRLASDLYNSRDANTFLRDLKAVFVRGWACIAHKWTADESGAEEGSIGTLWAGGWSSIGSRGDALSRTTWAGALISTTVTGIPIELPHNTPGWTSIGLAPTLQSPGELEFTTTGVVNSTEMYDLAVGGVIALFEGWITAGDGSSSGAEVFFEVIAVSGGVDRQITAKMDALNGRIRFLDPFAAADIGDIDADVTIPIQVFISIGGSAYDILWKRPWETRWRQGPESHPTGLTAGAGLNPNARIRFGHGATGTNTSRWRQWLCQNSGLWGIGYTPAADHAVLQYGGPVSTSPRPIPEVGSETAAAFLSASRGPAGDAEIFTIAPVYDYGIDRIFPTLSPSPDEPFRTVDALSDVVIAFEVDFTTLGPGWLWVFAFLRANFKTARVERHTGGSWVLEGEYNAAAGFEGLGFTRGGNWLRPNVGTINAGRPLRRNELAGGYAIFAGNITMKILGNSAGAWTDPALSTTLFPEVQLESFAGVPATGVCDLVFPNGVLFMAPINPQPFLYSSNWRIKIPIQDVPDDYIQLGTLFAGTLGAFGKQWARGWSREMRPNTSRRVSRYGTIRKRQQGPPVRRWSMSWADGVFEGRIRGKTSPDYLSQRATAAPLAMHDDVWTVLYGLLEETRGGEVPVIAIAAVPATGKTNSINDRTMFLYGTWDSSVQANQIQGDEGVDEFMRIDPIRISEIP